MKKFGFFRNLDGMKHHLRLEFCCNVLLRAEVRVAVLDTDELLRMGEVLDLDFLNVVLAVH